MAILKTIAKTFKKAGLQLRESKAQEVSKTTRYCAPQKLADIALQNTSGGIERDPVLVAFDVSLMAAATGTVGGMGCWIAGIACSSEGGKAKRKGDTAQSEKLTKAAKSLNIATGVCLGTCVLGLTAGKTIAATYHGFPTY